jgi:hypothetical protein
VRFASRVAQSHRRRQTRQQAPLARSVAGPAGAKPIAVIQRPARLDAQASRSGHLPHPLPPSLRDAARADKKAPASVGEAGDPEYLVLLPALLPGMVQLVAF